MATKKNPAITLAKKATSGLYECMVINEAGYIVDSCCSDLEDLEGDFLTWAIPDYPDMNIILFELVPVKQIVPEKGYKVVDLK